MRKQLIPFTIASLLILSACTNSSIQEPEIKGGIIQCGTEVIQPPITKQVSIISSEGSEIVDETDENYDPDSYRISDMRSCFDSNLKECHAAQIKHVEFRTDDDGIQEKLVTRALINDSCKIIYQYQTELPDSIKDSKKTFCYSTSLSGKKNKEVLTIGECDDGEEYEI